MKKLLLAFLLLCSVAGIAQINPPFIPRRGSADPNGSLACDPATGSLASLLYFRTSGTIGWYECTAAPNTWALWGTNSITGMTDPTTTTGDLIYRSSGGTARLAGNTTTTRKFLRQTGTGSASAAPVWDTLVAGDIPDISATYALASHTHAESDVTGLVGDLAEKAPTSRTITGATSITGGGDLSANRTLALVNDSATPGNSTYYGTDSSGTKGWFALSLSGGVTANDCGTSPQQYAKGIADDGTLSCGQVAYSEVSGTPTLAYQLIGDDGTNQTARGRLNLISGTNVTVSCADNAGSNSTDCTITGTGVGAGVASFSGDGSLISNSASTGTVTITLANAAAHRFWGNNTGSTGAPGYDTIGLSDLPSGVGLTASRIDQNNAATTSAQLASIISDETGSGGLVFGTSPTIVTPTIASFANATHNHTNSAGGGQLTGAAMSSFDISGLTVTSAFKPPASAGASPATDGVVAFDTTAHALVYGSNGTKVQAAAFSGSAPTSGDCVTWGSNGKVTDSGVVGCGGLSNPMIATGDLVKGGSSGVPARLAVNNDSVPQYVVSVSGDTSLVPGGVPVNAQTGTSYTVLKTDRLGLVTTSNASAIAVTLAQAQTTGDFANNFALVTKNLGAGTATWTPTTSSIDGGSSLALSQGEWCLLYSNNADYTSACSDGHITAGTNVNLSRSSSGVQIGLTGVDLPSNRIDQNNASTSSAQFASVISDETGTGVVVLQTSPNLITPSLGVATATSVNKVAITAPATGSTLTIADGKTFTVSNTITLTGTDSASYAMPTGSATVFGSTTKADALESALFCADAGSTDTYTCSLSPAISSYVAHRAYCFKANTINTGAATINFNSVGALTIKKPNGGSITSDLADGDIRAGQEVCGVYDGTNFQMTSQIGNSPVGSGTVTSVQNTVNGASSSGIFTVSGGPITGSGTINIALAGTSGGVPYFSSSSVLSSSSALTSNSVVLGGGAGAAPKVIAGITTDGTSKLTLGVAGTSVGASCFTNATSGTICLQPVTGALGTDTISIPARNSVVMATTSGSLTNGDVASYDSNGNLVDSTVVAANLTTQSSNGAANQVCTYTGANKVCVPGTVTGSMMTNNTVTATQLAAQYSKGSCTEVWSGSGTSSALQSGDDAISNNTCYNDSGVTRTITAVKCRSSAASNTTTVNPTFGSAGTGTTILSGALTCGSSYAYSSSGTVSNASWTTGSGIDPAMGGTLTGSSISVIVEYTY